MSKNQKAYQEKIKQSKKRKLQKQQAKAESKQRANERRKAWLDQMGQDQYGRYTHLTINGIQQRFRFIPEGHFMMGSPESEVGRNDDEMQHYVEIKKHFWMADTACTQAFWQAVISDNLAQSAENIESTVESVSSTTVMDDNPAYFTDDIENPVERVSWGDMDIFLRRINRYAPRGMVFRLPSEAEWEYACRAGTKTTFSFGDDINLTQANYRDRTGYGPNLYKGDYAKRTLPVKSFLPNDWGLYQMHGNVWEWCNHPLNSYENMLNDGSFSREDGWMIALRGGSWYDLPHRLRAACRNGNSPLNANALIGFRLVCAKAD